VRVRLHGASLDVVAAHRPANAPLVGAALLLTTPEGEVIH